MSSAPWTSNGRWVSHSLGCFVEEWAEWVEIAQLTGISTNGYLRRAVNEMARFDRLNLEDGTLRVPQAATGGDGTIERSDAA